VKYAHRSDKAYLYNVSAMLWFTRFFWEECVTQSEDPAVRKPGLLTMKSIEKSFGDLETLKEEMLDTADAMFGNGFVWLMKGKTPGDMRILATYNTGSPYKDAAPRRDDKDMATLGGNAPSLSDQLSGRMGDIATGPSTAGAFGDFSSFRSKHHAGLLDMAPILCVNVWEHQWLRDYGLLGKRAYLTAWWDRIDWQKVESAHNLQEWGSSGIFQQTSAQAPYSATGGSSVMDVLGN
jgi:superoxide dismutase, Fe-Mn family